MFKEDGATKAVWMRPSIGLPIVRSSARPTLIAASILVAAALLTAACALAVRSKLQGIDEMIAGAKTATDHEAIAARYDDEAAAASAKAEMHQRMAVSYRNLGGRGVVAHMDEHCESLARVYEQAAKENAALAQGHREMAK